MATPRQSVITPTLRRLLFMVFVLSALLAVNALYLAAVTFSEWLTGESFQDYFYLLNFLFHVVVGLLLLLPFVAFLLGHIPRGRQNQNLAARRAGQRLVISALVLIITGLVLTRFEFFEIKEPILRQGAYWLHVLTPLLAIYLFVVHRRMGRHFHPKASLRWVAAAAMLGAVMAVTQAAFQKDKPGLESEERPYFPALSRTSTGATIAPEKLMMDGYCKDCHADSHAGWATSVHRFSSFNNPAYLAAAKETREFLRKRDGHDDAFAFCAACHDPVPLFSGALASADFKMESDPLGQAGLTCSACHAIEALGSNRGNGDYVLADPTHYPFTYSEQPALQWLNQQLVKAKPDFHKRTFLQPLHKTAEFCSACHKVALPEELNGYKWLRGQNHYDSFLLSGVSGHGVSSFYYPPKAAPNCSHCHMTLRPSDDFAAQRFGVDELSIHDHQFAVANTGVPHLLGLPEETIEARRTFLQGTLRVDIFGLRKATANAGLTAPLRPARPVLQAGESYVLEVVVRTLSLGHLFTQGTADSNQIWLDVKADANGKTVGRNGAMRDSDGKVDPWSHFINAYVLDAKGQRVARRNAQDIHTVLYNHQIPPGAADVLYYTFTVPDDAKGELNLSVALNYRKFDTEYLRFSNGEPNAVNDLPVVQIASDQITLPIGVESMDELQSPWPIWQRWNDLGIGLLRKGQGQQLRQAEYAFKQVEALGESDGPLNLARVYLREGRLDEAAAALSRAADHPNLKAPWSVTWFSALVNKQNGLLEAALADFKRMAATDFADAKARGFDFSKDYRLLNQIGQTLIERSKQLRGDQRQATLSEAKSWLNKALAINSEYADAHFNLALAHAYLGDKSKSAEHRALHAKYKVDDNAGDKAVAIHRRNNPAANHAAEAVVVYDLQRPGAYGLSVANP